MLKEVAGVCAVIVFALLAAGLLSGVGASPADQIQIKTPQGILIGTRSGESGVSAFKGIPYALPPVGGRRWSSPEPTPDWEGQRAALRYGPDCIQPDTPEASLYYRPRDLQSEDCLYLNVWSPTNRSTKGAPVMVWIHGGALVRGSGSQADYDGEALARKGVVVVTINYRLGVFGFFAHPDLLHENEEGSAGNYGLMDQLAALRWVHDNIASLGGDPSNVTVFGQSAGAWSISLLMASPLSKGLFHKAILESGAYFFPMRRAGEVFKGRPGAMDDGVKLGKVTGASNLRLLRELPAATLLAAATKSNLLLGSKLAIIDGTVIKEPIYETYAAGRQLDIPVLVGFNSEEGSGIADYWQFTMPTREAEYRSRIEDRYGDLSSDYLTLYPSDNIVDSVFNAYRDGLFLWPMLSLARFNEPLHSSVYLYFFSHDRLRQMRSVPSIGVIRSVGAYHAAEIPFVFNQTRLIDMSSGDRSLADTMSGYWVSFATTGAPQHSGSPVWQAFEKSSENYMEFHDGAMAKVGLLSDAWDLNQRINDTRERNGVDWSEWEVGFMGRATQ